MSKKKQTLAVKPKAKAKQPPKANQPPYCPLPDEHRDGSHNMGGHHGMV